MTNNNKRKQGNTAPVFSNGNGIAALLISGYRFEDNFKNFLLSVCCGIPFINLMCCKMAVENFGPTQNSANRDAMIEAPKTQSTSSLLPPQSVTPADSQVRASIPLLFNRAFYLGQNNLLIANEKTGKSKLVGEILKHDSVKHPLIILREDYSDQDVNILRKVVGEKAIIVSLKKWREHEDIIQQNSLKNANFEICLQFLSPEYRRLQSITQQVLSRAKLNEKTSLNREIATFQSLVEILIEQENIDAVVLDSLNSLLSSGITHISRALIEKILRPTEMKHIMMLIAHHKNSRGFVYGSRAVSEAFDHIYDLSKSPSYKSIVNEELILEENSRSTAPVRLKFLRQWDNNGIPSYTVLTQDDDCGEDILSDEPLNLKGQIVEVLKHYEKESVPFEYLRQNLARFTPGAIKNSLRELEQSGLIKKADGKTWESITVLQGTKPL